MDNNFLALLAVLLIIVLVVAWAYRKRISVSAKGLGAEIRVEGEGGTARSGAADVPEARAATGAASSVSQTMTGSPGGQQVVGDQNISIQAGNVSAGRDAMTGDTPEQES
jgi:hypothetical protein